MTPIYSHASMHGTTFVMLNLVAPIVDTRRSRLAFIEFSLSLAMFKLDLPTPGVQHLTLLDIGATRVCCCAFSLLRTYTKKQFASCSGTMHPPGKGEACSRIEDPTKLMKYTKGHAHLAQPIPNRQRTYATNISA